MEDRIDERAALAMATVAGLAATLSDASPTGSTVADNVLILLSVGLVTWASAAAPWWTVAAIAGLSAVIAGSIVLVVVGLTACAVTVWAGITRRDLPVVRAAMTGIALNVLIRAELDAVLGLSAIVGIGSSAVVLALGLRRRSRRTVQVVLLGLAGAGVVAVVAVVGFAFAAGLGANDLSDGSESARAGIEFMNDGDYRQAAEEFEKAANSFESASEALTQPWSKAAQFVPIVAQHRTAAVELAATAGTASKAAGDALSVIDPDQLRLVDGQIDISAIESIEQPFLDVQAAIVELDTAVDDVSSPWLVAPLQDRLADLDDDIDEAKPKLDNAVQAVQVAPAMLGADGERRYLVAFTTPAETRGLGGFMSNWAELTADDGRLVITDFGLTADLDQGGASTGTGRTLDGPQEWLDLWGEYGFTSGPNGGTEAEPWSNVTISPHFPSTGEVIAQLLPQSGGDEIDGVFAMDPYVLEALLGLMGPITVEGSQTPLDETNVADFLLVDQYEIDDGEGRGDLLAAVSQATAEHVLGGALPSPAVLAEGLSPLASQGRLVGWAVDDDEQALLEAIHMSGALPDLAGGDGIAVVLNNAGDNRLDVYLQRELDYDATVDTATGEVSATATVTLTNTAPSSGLPDSVIGNDAGDGDVDDPGTNRTLLSLYSAVPIESASVTASATTDPSRTAEPEPFDLELGTEAGWLVGSGAVVIPPGESVTIVFDLAGTLSLPDGYTLAVRPQPIVVDEVQRLQVTADDGVTLIDEAGPATQGRILRAQ
ncbi:MAG: DUF4012 domain-containing protein [Ilumatobacteraceae bacterium]